MSSGSRSWALSFVVSAGIRASCVYPARLRPVGHSHMSERPPSQIGTAAVKTGHLDGSRVARPWTASASTCWRSTGWSARSSGARASPSGCSPTGSARTRRPARGPAMHLAARFCAKEAVAKALSLRDWSWRDIEVARRRRRAAGGAAGGHRRGARGRARRGGRDLADPHARDGRRRRGAEPMSLPRWLDPLLDAEQMRATDAWAIETRGIPSLDLMEHAGGGARRRGRRATRPPAASPSSAARATTAATGSSPRGCCARRAGRSTSCSSGRASGCRATPRRCSSGCRGPEPRAVRRGGA